MAAEPQSKPFSEWLGRTSEASDRITPRLVESFRAVFDPHLAQTATGAAPLGIHWCLCPAIVPMAQLGGDGHPARNLSLPPVPLPRRMWAGGMLEAVEPMRIGDEVVRRSTIADVTRKQGRSGELWFVVVNHEYATGRGVALRERHDIVYREAARPGVAGAAPPRHAAEPAAHEFGIDPTPALLFRYSAITFNGHRIHYDLPYATGVEGYEGLVVHGPLQATLLLNLAAARLGHVPAGFAYRGLFPAIAGRPLAVRQGTGDRRHAFWTEGPGGVRHMEVSVE